MEGISDPQTTEDVMHRFSLALAMLSLPTLATAQTRDHAPVALGSADELQHDKPRSESWTYVKPQAGFTRYRSILIDPTAIYTGSDAQFDGVSMADRQKYAALMTGVLKADLASTLAVVTKPGPGVLRVRLTLVGMEKTKGGFATVTRVTPVGLLTSSVQSLAGKKGTMSGSILFAVEIKDSRTGDLLAAAVRRRAPDALDIGSTLSTESTVKAVARDLASHLAARLGPAMRGAPPR
ncbi:hypothetical protein GCM10009095_22350 [Sphingomonas molluscorum]|nr:hypothetical protein GCM10017606_08120 [Microbacterium terregens]